MKFFLPKLTAMAMVAASADALRSSDNKNVASGLSNVCDDGYDDGAYYTRQLWEGKPNYGNCDNVWGFDKQADRDVKDQEFPPNCSSTYCNCGRDGVDDEVNEIEAECTWDNTDECNDLGNAAAERVVMRDWCSPGRSQSQSDTYNPNWKAICANEAVGICEGNVQNVARRWCPDKNMNGNDRNFLQDQCYDEVDSMVGNDVRRPPTARPTRRPTRRPTPRPNPSPNRRPPTRRPTRRPTPRPNSSPNPRPPTDRDDRCGRDGKCGNCKQEFCPDVQERKDCKARLCSLEDELTTTEIN